MYWKQCFAQILLIKKKEKREKRKRKRDGIKIGLRWRRDRNVSIGVYAVF